MNGRMRFLAALLAVIALVGCLNGCSKTQPGGDESQQPEEPQGLKINFTVDDKLAGFFMDREYALTATDTETTQSELDKAGAWLSDYVLNSSETGKSAFEFTIDGKSFRDNISEWTLVSEMTGDDNNKTDWTLTYTKSGEPLEVVVYATQYKEYAIIEWTVWIENNGAKNSGTITGFLGLDETFAADCAESEMLMTTFKGSNESSEAFKAEQMLLEPDASKRVAGTGGKASVNWSPYINLQWADEQARWGKAGVFVSTGWPGQWQCVSKNTGEGVLIQAGQEKLETYLKPGERVRSPLMTLLFWEQDLMRSQNLWRRWVYTVTMPQPNGAPIPTQLSGNTAQDTELTVTATDENQLAAIRLWEDIGLDIDSWQMDAGWYEMLFNSGSWTDTGNWWADPARFGEDLSDISNLLHEYGLKLILWYEPERISSNTAFFNLQDKGYVILDRGWHTYNLASDEATDYLIDYMIESIAVNGVDTYRQDCNINTPSFSSIWGGCDEEGQSGLTENKYLVNYLRYFDALLAAYPDTYIDSCASGGRRLDLETTRRAVALWRDDQCYEPTLTQCQSWGINFFMPYSGQGSLEENPSKMTYTFRSNMMTSLVLPWRVREGDTEQHERYKDVIADFRSYAPYMTQDYYPLTPYANTDADWMAWQYNDYTDQTGMIQVFKRPQSTQTEARYLLSGLDPEKSYSVTDVDTGDSVELTGEALMVDGVVITITGTFAAKIFHYEPVA